MPVRCVSRWLSALFDWSVRVLRHVNELRSAHAVVTSMPGVEPVDDMSVAMGVRMGGGTGVLPPFLHGSPQLTIL